MKERRTTPRQSDAIRDEALAAIEARRADLTEVITSLRMGGSPSGAADRLEGILEQQREIIAIWRGFYQAVLREIEPLRRG